MRLLPLFIVALTLWGASSELWAEPEALVLRFDQSEYSLEGHLEVWQDSTTQVSMDEILQGSDSAIQFQTSTESIPNFGHTDSAIWIRFTILNSLPLPEEMLLEIDYPIIHHIELYQIEVNGDVVVTKSGTLEPFANKEVPHRNFLFNFNVDAQEHKVVYLRFLSQDTIHLPLTLWKAQTFYEEDHQEQYVLGSYFGMMMVMLVYNLLIFIGIKDRTYLIYVFYIASFILFQLSATGLGAQYLWPDSPRIASWSLTFFIFTTVELAILFFRNFLKTPKRLPRVDQGLLWAMWICLLGMLALFWNWSLMIQFITIYTALLSLALLIISVWAWKLGIRTARYFLIAWISLLIGTIVFILADLGIIPVTFFSKYAVQFGSAMEITLLSLGLANLISQNRLKARTLSVRNAEISRFNNALSIEVKERQKAQEALAKQYEETQKKEQELTHVYQVIQEELEIASKIQTGILPELDSAIEGVKMVSHYQSMEKVGGDIFNIIPMNNGDVGIFMADAVGHGIPAAFITMMSQIVFEEMVRKHKSPKSILRQANQSLGKVFRNNEYLTAFFVVISPDLQVTYGNANHPHPIVIRKGKQEVERWTSKGMFLGFFGDEEVGERYQDKTDRLYPGDRVFFYTDGLTEAPDEALVQFGENRLKDILLAMVEDPLEEVKEHILERWRTHIGEKEVRDDMTFLMLEIEELPQS